MRWLCRESIIFEERCGVRTGSEDRVKYGGGRWYDR